MGKPVRDTMSPPIRIAAHRGGIMKSRRGEEVVESSEPDYREYAKAMKAGTIHATELEPIGG